MENTGILAKHGSYRGLTGSIGRGHHPTGAVQDLPRLLHYMLETELGHGNRRGGALCCGCEDMLTRRKGEGSRTCLETSSSLSIHIIDDNNYNKPLDGATNQKLFLRLNFELI